MIVHWRLATLLGLCALAACGSTREVADEQPGATDQGGGDKPAGSSDDQQAGKGGAAGLQANPGGVMQGPSGGSDGAPAAGAGAGAAAGGGATPMGGTGGMEAKPPPVAGPDSLHFAVIGDYGDDFLTNLGIGNEDKVAAMVKGWDPEFIVTVGDNNYPDGEASTIDRNVGKYFAEYIHPYMGEFGPGAEDNRFWPSLGNHDWQTGSIDAYLDYFELPNNERYYELDMGLIHFFFIDSEAEEPDGKTFDSVQGQWFEPRIKASTACYQIAVFHRPGYASRQNGGDPPMRWPFEEWGIDAILTGHHHFYERLQVGGIPLFVGGNGGSGLYQIEDIVPESMVLERIHGAMEVHADRKGLTFDAYDLNSTMIDTLQIPGCE